MKRPAALSALLDELQEEAISSDVEINSHSKAILYADEDAIDDDDGIELKGDECRLLFASQSTVERFLDILEDAQSASIALFDVTIPVSVLEILERNVAAIDEG